jgi:UDP-2-acetamido-3-amino-2,3-dideoxy-glucuronate N-acetyltransferase
MKPSTTRSAKQERSLRNVIVHPQAIVESSTIGSGTRVWAFAHVMENAVIGSNCNICDHVFIESNAKLGKNVTVKNGVAVWDGVQIEDDVFIGPYVVFTNDLNPRAEIKKPREQWLATLIRRGVTIGANATVLCGISVGTYAFVAAGTVVTSSVPNYALIVGVPGRLSGWMCKCATKLQILRGRAVCKACGLRYAKDENGLREAQA